MRTWKAKVKVADGSLIEVRVQAADSSSAKKLLEAQYGKGNVRGFPMEVR